MPSFLSKRLTILLAILALSMLALFSVLGGRQTKEPANILHAQAMRANIAKAVSNRASLFPTGSRTPSPLPSLSSVISLPSAPNMNAHSFLVQFIGDDAPLLARREGKQMHPASLTKILTSLLAVEELDHESPVIFSLSAKATGEKESPVPAGESFVRDDMIRFAMIESANDAAVALAEAIGRKRGAFSFDDAMTLFNNAANQKAKELGMAGSHIENPTGLDNGDHYMTTQDLFRLVSYIWNTHPEIWTFSRSPEADLQSLTQTSYHIVATNQLLSEFPALQGGKTGLTDKAKGTLILLYPVKPDRTAVIIILGSDDRFADGRLLIKWLEQAFP